MNVGEAKDFLVQQTVEQAALEHVPFSDLERCMMYFTESGDCPEDPIALNDAFEAEYDNDEYEAKMRKLLRNACRRLKHENPQSTRTWDDAVQELRKGDHYLLVLFCNTSRAFSVRQFLPSWSFWRLLAFGFIALVSRLLGSPGRAFAPCRFGTRSASHARILVPSSALAAIHAARSYGWLVSGLSGISKAIRQRV